MQNLFQKTTIENHISNTGKKTLNIHKSVYAKLENFHKTNKIPHLIFHGMSGSGKRTIVNKFLNMIYEDNKPRMKSNIMVVNCAHGKGIKFIREELKFFAKTNINSNNGTIFKTIVLINADNLTIDAQSALRRCIEQFSFNTRFFIIIENKHKLLKPILSRFCEIYIPEHMEDGQICNLHEISKNMNYQIQYTENNNEWLANIINTYADSVLSHTSLIQLCDSIVEYGLSCIDVIEWIKKTSSFDDSLKAKVIIYFDIIRREYRFEKMIMLSIFDFLYLRSNKDLKSITEL
jgi:replication factor C small subunit